jgi:hypothetical protein
LGRFFQCDLASEAAAAELDLWAGRQFDAEVVAAFHRVPKEDWPELHRQWLLPKKDEKLEVQVVGVMVESHLDARVS